MEPADLHHLSAIRIGDRIVYNGVGGNAFAFGEKPDLAAFALGPYPNPNVPDSPISKSKSEPNYRVEKISGDFSLRQKAQDRHKDYKVPGKDVIATTTTVLPRRLSEPQVQAELEIGSFVEPKSSDKEAKKNPFNEEADKNPFIEEADKNPFNEETDKNPFNEETDKNPFNEKADKNPFNKEADKNPFNEEADKNPINEEADKNSSLEKNNSDATTDHVKQQVLVLEVGTGMDKNALSSSKTLSKNTKSSIKPTLKEVAMQAESNKSQHLRSGSWGAFSNLGTKIANRTSALMTYTVNTTMNATQKALPLPPPPRSHRKLPQIPQPPLPFPVPLPPPPPHSPSKELTPISSAPKTSTLSTSSKSSSRSSTPTKLNAPKTVLSQQENVSDRRTRQMPSPSPSAVGLPPILPRPPAAHLPPPLPSRPPATMRLSCPSSPSSSIKSSVSQRPSPDDDSDSDVNDHHEFVDTASGKGPSQVFRSSGTIRLYNRPLTPSSQVGGTFPKLGSSSDTSSKYHSPGSSAAGVNPFTSERKQSNHSFSTISAAVVGTPGSHHIAKSSKTSSTLSHQISVSTPDLRSQRTAKQTVAPPPNHYSDDEGVFEGADTSDTLSADENEVTVPAAQNKNEATSVSDQPQKKKVTKQHSLDSGKTKEMKNSKAKLFAKSPETDEKVLKNKRLWFFPKKTNETDTVSGSSTIEQVQSTESNPNLSLESNSRGDKLQVRPPKTRSKQAVQSKIKSDNSPNCRKCKVKFGFRSARSYCHRCHLAFCMTCAPVTRCDLVSEGKGLQAPSLVKLCLSCKEELLMENSRGATRGLWSEFQKMRSEARDNRGLDVTSSTLHKHLESESVLDVTPGLRTLCIKFLVNLHQQLQKQPRHKFLTNYLHFENPMKQQQGNAKKVKNCHACERYLRIMSDIRECGICNQVFCMACTWKTLQVYLPKGTDLRADIQLDMIRFHVKETEIMGKGEVTAAEASEVYRVCASCEDVVARNIHVYEFDARVPELEAELFDLQRQIDHCLTFSPFMFGIQRSVSTAQLNNLDEEDFMATCMKHVNRLYDRYTRAYDSLNKLMPQTGGQKALHKHIKQAMYDFYLKRRDQLKSTWRRRDSCENVATECNDALS